MSHICDITNITHLVAQMSEQFEQQIEGYSRTGMSEMSLTINGRTADIHAHTAWVYGFEHFFLVTFRIRYA